MSNQSLGSRGEALIKSRETLCLVAYKPTPDDVWTCGWGHTHGVTEGMTCTPEQAEAWFRQDTQEAANEVNALGISLTQSMFDALVSLVYNVGAGAILPSLPSSPIHPASTIGAALRTGNYFSAWAGFSLWRKQAGHDLLGLARRRSAEMVLFLEDDLP